MVGALDGAEPKGSAMEEIASIACLPTGTGSTFGKDCAAVVGAPDAIEPLGLFISADCLPIGVCPATGVAGNVLGEEVLGISLAGPTRVAAPVTTDTCGNCRLGLGDEVDRSVDADLKSATLVLGLTAASVETGATVESNDSVALTAGVCA